VRWFTLLMPVLAVAALVAGFSLRIKDVFQASTGWLGFFVFTAAFFILFGMERLLDEAR
jgi:uncharacterized membrane-anchored protein YitT (DUF2179 family)